MQALKELRPVQTKDNLKVRVKQLEQENEDLRKALMILADFVDDVMVELGFQGRAQFSIKKLLEEK